jgi:hypothetical protein
VEAVRNSTYKGDNNENIEERPKRGASGAGKAEGEQAPVSEVEAGLQLSETARGIWEARIMDELKNLAENQKADKPVAVHPHEVSAIHLAHRSLAVFTAMLSSPLCCLRSCARFAAGSGRDSKPVDP